MTPRTNKMPPTETESRRIFLPALTVGMVLFALAGAVLALKRTLSPQPIAGPSTNAMALHASSGATAPFHGGVKVVRQRAATPRVTVPSGAPDSAQVTAPVQPSTASGSRTTDSTDP